MNIMTRSLLLSTAITLPLGGLSMAQSPIDINEDALAEKSQECQMLATAYRDAADPSVISRDDVVTAVNDDRTEECATLEDRLMAQAQTSEDSTEASDTETENVSERVDLSQDATIQGEAEVTVPDPNVDVQVPAPTVNVTKQQPQVSVTGQAADIQVNQKRPTVTVEIPEIIVRVDNPAPDVYVLNPNPDVSVSTADPQVDVEQGDPQVEVTQADPELNVDLGVDANGDPAQAQATTDTSDADGSQAQNVEGDTAVSQDEPTVEIVQAEGEPQVNVDQSEPNVSFEGAEPQVSVTIAKQPTVEIQQSGQPNVVIETPQERQQRLDEQQASQEQGEPAQQNAEAETAGGSEMAVRDLMNMEVVTVDGEDLGNPEAFVELEGEPNLILSSGGFLGLGVKEVPVRMSRVTMEGDRLVVESMTEDDVEAASDFEYDSNVVLADDQVIQLSQQ